MNTSEYLRTGDAVNLTVTLAAYPFEVEYDSTGELATNLTLQGRIVFADALGVCLYTFGGRIMPSFDPDTERLLMPADGRGGNMFPWHSITGVTLLSRAADYNTAWDDIDAAMYVYAEAHLDALPVSAREYREWAATQDADDLRTRVEAAKAGLR